MMKPIAPGHRYRRALVRAKDRIDNCEVGDRKAMSDLVHREEIEAVLDRVEAARALLRPLSGIAAVDEAMGILWNAYSDATKDLSESWEALGPERPSK